MRLPRCSGILVVPVVFESGVGFDRLVVGPVFFQVDVAVNIFRDVLQFLVAVFVFDSFKPSCEIFDQ